MKVGFLNNQIDNRGTGNATFDYAVYNEEILGNESFMLTFPETGHNSEMWERVRRRFGFSFGLIDKNWFPDDIDVLYHIKSGEDDGFRPPEGVRYAVHAVFNYSPHGDRYAVVSPWLASIHNSPVVPHIINLPETELDLRDTLGLPKDAVVFGRHGGYDSFDIDFVWGAIIRAIRKRKDIHFVFLNTAKPDFLPLSARDRVIFLDDTADPFYKAKFINTCNAMLHARARGETFGIACGEFASKGKPIITYGLSPERNHLEEVMCYTYNDEDELVWHLTENEWLSMDRSEWWTGYTQYTPENVMKQFKEVFLD